MTVTLRAARVNADLTQDDVATELKVDRATISRWEKGRGMPTLVQLKKMLKMYGLGFEDLRIEENDQDEKSKEKS